MINTSLKKENRYDIWLSQCKNVGNVRAKLLVDYFGSSQNIYNAGYTTLEKIYGLGHCVIKDLMNKDLTNADMILSACEQANLGMLTISDSAYPAKLRNIYDPPAVLYIKGKLPDVDTHVTVGIVGTRNCTPYGYKHAKKLAEDLSKNNIIIVTGLAIGIDTAAATGALSGVLETNMPMIGVVGCGADVVYPARNKDIFNAVVTHGGAVVSEYPPGTPARPEFFPSRNRIISGLSNGIAVIEAPERSGALITAQRAVEQNRDVFILPGSVDSGACKGSNKLLRDGAIPFMTADDIIDEYRNIIRQDKKPIDNNVPLDYIDLDTQSRKLNGINKSIYKAIGYNSLYADEIIETTGLTPQAVLSSLTQLELDGYISHTDNGKWENIFNG